MRSVLLEDEDDAEEDEEEEEEGDEEGEKGKEDERGEGVAEREESGVVVGVKIIGSINMLASSEGTAEADDDEILLMA